MTIKDAAERTGLTPKSIRYYETKGLLSVARGAENAYRHYTDEDLERLKLIKILRWLGLTVEEIGDLARADWKGIPEALRGLSLRLESDSRTCLTRREVCDSLAKDWDQGDPSAVIGEYSGTVGFLESDEGRGILEQLTQSVCQSFAGTLLTSLIWLGPIGWLFFRIFLRKWETLPLTAVLALLSAAALTLTWVGYFRTRRQHRNRVREANRNNRLLIPLVLLAVVLAVAAVIGLFLLREKLLTPPGWLFYEAPWWADLGLIGLTGLTVLSAVGLLIRRGRLSGAELEEMSGFLRFLGRTWKVSVPILLLILYCCLFSGTYVTETGILRRTPLRPGGTIYSDADVSAVETGFGSARFSPAEYRRRGQFFYRIILNDGAEAVFHSPQPNNGIDRYSGPDSSYLELEEFDQRLMAQGTPKTSSETNAEFCEYDAQFVDRFLRIIRSAPKTD